MQHVIEREFVFLVDLENADDPVRDVAILVEADLSLQRLDLRGLERVAKKWPPRLSISPIKMPPTIAPVMLPMPPKTAAVKARNPAV